MNESSHDPDCLFCKLVRGEIPAVKVFEDDQTLAFMDIFPVSRGHLLLIGKQHHVDIYDIAAQQLTAIGLNSQRLARALRQALRPDGLRVVQFNGAEAGQTVFHYHLHLRPAYAGQDGARGHGNRQADPAELEATAAMIRTALADS